MSSTPPKAGAAQALLVRMRSVETLQAAYDAWAELKREDASTLAALKAERARLDTQGDFLMGAVRAAGAPTASPAPGTPGLARRPELETFLGEAEAKLQEARAAVEARLSRHAEVSAAAFRALKHELRARVQRLVGVLRPRLELTLHPAGPGKVVLHLARLEGDDAVVLLYLLTGCIPTRHDFLEDESTDDLRLPSAPLYAEEGVASDQTRPNAPELRALTHEAEEAFALKGWIPLWLDRSEGGVDFFRLRSRGPVLEAEVEEGTGFRNLLAREEAERVAGYLLRLKLAGKVELELKTS